MPSRPHKVFISYAHEDQKFLEKLKDHFSLLVRQEMIELWYDRCIEPGVDWEKEIDSHLDEADIIFFLVSPSFIASDHCYGIELKRALGRRWKCPLSR